MIDEKFQWIIQIEFYNSLCPREANRNYFQLFYESQEIHYGHSDQSLNSSAIWLFSLSLVFFFWQVMKEAADGGGGGGEAR